MRRQLPYTRQRKAFALIKIGKRVVVLQVKWIGCGFARGKGLRVLIVILRFGVSESGVELEAVREPVFHLKYQAVVPGIDDAGDIRHETKVGIRTRPGEEWRYERGCRICARCGASDLGGSANRIGNVSRRRKVRVEKYGHPLCAVQHVNSADGRIGKELALDRKLTLIDDGTPEIRVGEYDIRFGAGS